MLFSRRNAIFAFLIVSLVFLNCPKRLGPTTEKIEIVYIGSVFDDIYRPQPLLAETCRVEVIKLGSMDYKSPSWDIMLERSGFFAALSDLGIDFIIMDRPVYGRNFFPIRKSFGYAIDNYKGIRFAIVSKDIDSLTIQEETKLTLIRERSDVLWLIDRDFLKLPPMKVDFIIKGRELVDTNMTAGATSIVDSTRILLIRTVRERLDGILSRRIVCSSAGLAEYTFQELSRQAGVNVILYPQSLAGIAVKQEYLGSEILKSLPLEMKFTKSEMTKKDIEKMVKENKNLRVWGKIEKKNIVALPSGSDDGIMLYDIILGK